MSHPTFKRRPTADVHRRRTRGPHRDTHTAPLAFPGELIIDNFAGGGGTSTGLEAAFGRPVDIAINHDPEALAMHAANHPFTLHLCESVWRVHPVEVTRNQPVALVWLSPDCKHFSKAKGGTPVSRDIRGLAWVGIRWVLETAPRVLMLENVSEFKSWGPVIELPCGKVVPDKARAGETFQAFCAMLTTGVAADHPALAEACHFLEIEPGSEKAQRLVRGLGYQLDVRELRACDHDTPTIRKRLFVAARRDGLPIEWPAATHAEPGDRRVLAGKLAPFRTAADCIDFHDQGRSIFDPTRSRPLARNTLRRVAKGAWRHVLTSAKPYIVNTRNGEREGQQPRERGVDAPTWTATSQGSQGALVQPVLSPFLTEHANSSNQRTMPADEPLRTQLAQVKGGHFSAVTASLIDMGHGESSSTGAKRWSHGVRDLRIPLGTCTAGNPPSALVTAFLEQANGGFYAGEGRPADAPVSTITSSGSNQQLVTAYLVKYYSSGGQWQDAGQPMHTLPTKGRMGLVQLAQVSVDCLQPEQLGRARQCASLLHEHLPEHFPEPADLVLVFVGGAWMVLADLFLRMLRPRELFNAQGFPAEYVIERVPDPKLLFVDGKQVADPRELSTVPLSTTAQVRMVGNSVCPKVAEALARVNFAHEAQIYGRVAA